MSLRCITAPALVAALSLALLAAARADMPTLDGQVRLRWDEHTPASQGPLAQGAALDPAVVAPPVSSAALETELRGRLRWLAGSVTLRQERPEAGPVRSEATVDELYASADAAGWSFTAGRRIVAWDVGYGFRPNDVVQQEPRRTLLPTLPQGRAVLQAEHFGADSAWSLVWVNPQRAFEGGDGATARGADEQALAARVYQRAGTADWHGFARWGVRTHGSLGAAVSWVPGESVEIHASVRWAYAADALSLDPDAPVPARTNPYAPGTERGVGQVLLGMQWTGENHLSLMAEAWYDGAAASNGPWVRWAVRNDALARLAETGGTPPALRGALAGNLGWQGQALAGQNLRRGNLFVRAAWERGAWQPSLDWLYTPADRGQIVTAALGWQGDRLRVDLGLRQYGGPGGAVAAQLPNRRVAYAALTWAF